MDFHSVYFFFCLQLPVCFVATSNIYYSEIPRYYRQLFESGDKFSAIIQYAQDVERIANISNGKDCPGGRNRFPLSAFNKFPNDTIYYDGFEKYQRTALSIANLLNYIYQLAKRPFEDWFKIDIAPRSYSYEAFWYSIVSSVVASDRMIFGCYVILYDETQVSKEVIPHAYRDANKVAVEDYTKLIHIDVNTPEMEWLTYNSPVNANVTDKVSRRNSQAIEPSQKINAFSSQILKDSGNAAIKVVTESEGFWGPPVFFCDKKKWLFSYRLPFFLSKSINRLQLKGWVVLEFDLNVLEINRCKNESNFRTLYATDICNYATTKCEYIPGQRLTDINFRCGCKRFFHQGGFNGKLVREEYLKELAKESNNYSRLECGPCPSGCEHCTLDGSCLIKYDLQFLRAFPMVIQIFCITICAAVGVVIFRSRRSRVIKSTVWILLEIFLLGVIILYSTIVFMYLEPNYEICFILPWFREIGFAVTYGTLIINIYRILCSFQSRKAHRVHVKDRDLLKYLAGIVAVAIGYMSAYTATNLDHSRRAKDLLESGNCSSARTADLLVLQDGEVGSSHLGFRVCALGFWDMVTAIVELAVLVLGLFYCYCVRSAPSEYAEVRCITIAFICEMVFSFAYHISRHFIWLSLHPDYVYIISFARYHLTVTVTAVLVIGPKLWYIHNPPDVDSKDKKMRYSQVDTNLGEAINLNITSNGDIDIPEVNLTDMDPDDIRAELKRLYTQLEIYKTKVMRKDNPHISKRRGGRKQTHRRFSLQAFHHKHSHKHQTVSVQEEEISKVSEDSSNSAEDPERAGTKDLSKNG